MLGMSSLHVSPQFSLKAMFIRPDLLRLFLITSNQNRTQDIDEQFVQNVTNGRIGYVQQFYHSLRVSEKYEFISGPSLLIRVTFNLEPSEELPITLAFPIPHKIDDPVKPQFTKFNQAKIEEDVAQQIFLKLIENPNFLKTVATRSQLKVAKINESIRQIEELCNSQSVQIKKLKKEQKQMREELRATKTELRKLQYEQKKPNQEAVCPNSEKVWALQDDLSLQKNMISTMGEEITHLQKVQKGYNGRKVPPLEQSGPTNRNKSVDPMIESKKEIKEATKELLYIDENCLDFRDFYIKDSLIELKETDDIETPKKSSEGGKPMRNWRYIYFQNSIPYLTKSVMEMNIIKCKEGNISFGIVEEKYSHMQNCFNAASCIEYVGFSRTIFQGGKPCLKVGKVLEEGDYARIQVSPSLGIVTFKSFSGLIAHYESARLRNGKGMRYRFFLRMKNKEDKVQIISGMA